MTSYRSVLFSTKQRCYFFISRGINIQSFYISTFFFFFSLPFLLSIYLQNLHGCWGFCPVGHLLFKPELKLLWIWNRDHVRFAHPNLTKWVMQIVCLYCLLWSEKLCGRHWCHQTDLTESWGMHEIRGLSLCNQTWTVILSSLLIVVFLTVWGTVYVRNISVLAQFIHAACACADLSASHSVFVCFLDLAPCRCS